jgi:hypothetical protein
LLITITTSCSPHTIYKTNTVIVEPPQTLLKKCEVSPVKAGATTQEELLFLVSEAYVETLRAVANCNIKTEEVILYIQKVKENLKGEK